MAKAADPTPTAVYGRLAAAFAALVAGTGAVIVSVLLLQGLEPITATATTSSTATATTPAPAATTTGFPAPPKGAVVLAARAGDDGVGLAVSPGASGIGLQASVVGYPKGISGGIKGLEIRFEVERWNHTLFTTPVAVACGPGCYRSSAPIPQPAAVTVWLAGHKPSTVAFALPAEWPPPTAEATVSRAARVWRGLRTLEFDDRLSTGGSLTLDTIWKVVAPDKIAYEIKNSGSSVIIGDRRWDKPAGGSAWQESQQVPVVQPQPFWASATDARLLGTVSVHGRPAWQISFYDPRTPGWFTILVDKATMHTVDIRMTAIAHFMHDTYGPFNAPISIAPPK